MEINRTIGQEIELGSIAVELGILTDEQLLAAIGRWIEQKDLRLKSIFEQDYHVDSDDFELAQALLAKRNKLGSTVAASIDDTHGFQFDSFSESADQGSDQGNEFGRFERIRQFAQGGLGLIYEGRDRELDRTVAIKELGEPQTADPYARERFFRESAITASLEHPSIVPVHGRGFRADGTPFYAMRFIQGKTLRQVADGYHATGFNDPKQKRMEFRKLVGYLVPVGQAIAYAHSKNVIHRDLKPSNVIVGQHGETMLIDWGLARRIDERDFDVPTNRLQNAKSTAPDLTAAGTVLGTLAYMSPEQARGDSSTGQATDIYGLGAILFYVLTGSPPREGDPSSMNERACRGIFDEHKLHSKGVSRQLAAVCMKALSTLPSQRYSSAESFIIELENYLADEPVSALPESNWRKIRRWATAHQAVVTGGLASLFVSLVGMSILLSVLSSKNETLRQANLREQKATLNAIANAEVAKKNGDEAIRQRQRVLGILNTFLVDVERGLAKVPGSAAVQRNVLTTVLNKLGEISKDFAADEVNLSNAKALVDMGDLFSRIGTKDIKLDLPRWKQMTLSPLEAANEMYAEAMQIVLRSASPSGKVDRRMIAMIQQKQADILRQTARTSEALQVLDESLAMRRILQAESPESVDAAMDLESAVELQGQIFLQGGDLEKAKSAFGEAQSILNSLPQELQNAPDVKRRLGVIYSRLADIAVREGDLDLASQLYDKDLTITTEAYQAFPDDLTSKRDLCTLLDRIGNMSTQRGQPEKAMESYLESRRLRIELFEAEPTNTNVMHELFVSYMKGGDTRMLLKEVDAAKADYEKALILADEMALIDPASANAMRLQSMSAEVLADVSIREEQLGKALEYARKSFEISQKLLEKDPTDGQKQEDVFICRLKVAKVHFAMENFEACLSELNKALPSAQAAYEQQPDTLQTARHYSMVLLRIAEAQLAIGNALEAAKQCEAVISVLESVPEDKRQDAMTKRRIVNTLTMLGRAQIANKKTAEANDALERAKQLANKMIADEMRVEQMRLDLEEIESVIASLANEN